MATTLTPTGHCYEDAIRFFDDCRMANNSFGAAVLTDAIICHGVIHGYAHAWVESQKHCFERAWLDGKLHWTMTEHADFHADVSKVIRYTYEEARLLHDEHGRCGPWDPELLAKTAPPQGGSIKSCKVLPYEFIRPMPLDDEGNFY